MMLPDRPSPTPAPARRAALRSATLQWTACLVAAVAIIATAPGCSVFDKHVDVLLIGDSIMNQTQPFVKAQIRLNPSLDDAKVTADAVNGTGLMTPKLYDWQTKAVDLAKETTPIVTVILFVGNYTNTDLFIGADGKEIPNDYSQAFFDEWGRQTEKLVKNVQATGSQVYLVLPPPLYGDEGHRREEAMRKVYVDLARRVPGIGLVDARSALGGTNGEFQWQRPGIDGKEVTVRQSDTVHLTDEGGKLLAREIANSLSPALLQYRRLQASKP